MYMLMCTNVCQLAMPRKQIEKLAGMPNSSELRAADAELNASFGRTIVNWNVFRAVVVIGLLIYGITMSIQYHKKTDEEDRQDLTFLHTLWFGNHGVLMMIFWLMLSVFLVMVGVPLIKYAFSPSAKTHIKAFNAMRQMK